jgi:adenylate cyclase
VNVASRVESACKEMGYDLLVTAPTHDAAPGLAYLPAGGMALKGKSERVVIYLLVGDAAMAQTPEFRELEAAHAEAIAALSAGNEPGPAIVRCRELALALEPGLGKFYDKLAGRAEDFATLQRAAE